MEFANSLVKIYSDESLWNSCRSKLSQIVFGNNVKDYVEKLRAIVTIDDRVPDNHIVVQSTAGVTSIYEEVTKLENRIFKLKNEKNDLEKNLDEVTVYVEHLLLEINNKNIEINKRGMPLDCKSQIGAAKEFCDFLQVDHEQLYYKEMLKNQDPFFNSFLDSIGIKRQEFSSNVFKVTSNDLSKSVSNTKFYIQLMEGVDE